MGSNVPAPSSDLFTSELCLFLSSLSTTSGTQFASLSSQLVRLREALLEEAVKERQESDSENETFEDEETAEETLSEISTEKDTDDTNSTLEDESAIRTVSTVHECSRPPPSGTFVSINNHKVMLSLQKGSRYELEERLVKQTLSQFGKVVKLKLYQMPIKGAWGFAEFRTTHSAAEALNQVIRAGNCWLHTSLPMEFLTQFPVPHQILLESRYLPQVWEKEIVLRSFFSKFGVVTGVTLFGFGYQSIQRFIISFKESSVAQELIGTTVKILTCTVVVKEVSSSTVRGEEQKRRSGRGNVSEQGDVGRNITT